MLMLPAFVPQGLFSVAMGIITPIVPLTALSFGSSVAGAALVMAMVGIGQIAADAPAGWLTSLFGERAAMISAGTVSALTLMVIFLSTSLPLLYTAVFVLGMSNAMWQLARITFVADRMPYHLRARAMSTLGGSQRIGFFIGPFLGAGVIHLADTRSAYVAATAATVAAVAVLASVREQPATSAQKQTSTAPRTPAATKKAVRQTSGYISLLRNYRRVFTTLGIGIIFVNITRTSRQVVLPLWGEHIGLDPATVSLIFGASAAIEIVLFYPAGKLMDVRGRSVAAVGSMLGLAIGHFLLPLASTSITLVAVGLLLGIGNGFSAGLIMTIGADIAPPDDRPLFFGVWRILADIGNSGGPLAVSAISVVAPIAVAIIVLGGAGIFAALSMARWLPRHPTSA